MMLNQLTKKFKETIKKLKKIAIDFENGTINTKTLLTEISAMSRAFSLESLEDSLEATLLSPDSLRKKTLNEACVILAAFRTRMLEMMTAAMQKLMTMRPRVPIRRYGGNVVETTPAALTVALEYANKLVRESTNKNLAAGCLTSFRTAIAKLEELIVLHHNNIIATAYTRGRIVAMLPASSLSALKQQKNEETK